MTKLLIFAYIINFITIITIVFFQRRDPIVSLAWVMFFMLTPLLGPLIFIVFGLGIKRRTRNVYHKKQLYGEELANRLAQQIDFLDLDAARELHDLDTVRYLCKYNSLFTDDNEVEIYTDAAKKYERLIEDIEAATESINLLYFIIRKDEIGERLMDTLVKKAEQGVTVRLLYDSFGCFFTPKKFLRRLNKTKCGCAASFFPVSIFTLSKINHRNHRKIAVIDHKAAYIGGMNIGDEYMGKKKPAPWRDTHIRVVGEAVGQVYRYFCLDWDFSTHDHLSDSLGAILDEEKAEANHSGIPMQIVASGPDSPAEEIKCGMIKLINNARRYVYIQTPYFVPDKAFMNALIMAADSGLDVRLMIPGVPDKKYVYYSSLSYLEELFDAGIKVYLYDGFIHSKTLVADDKTATIGTTNIDIRSFQLHFEINAFFYSEAVARRCREIFTEDIASAHLLTGEEYKKRPLAVRMKEGFFRLFSQIM